MGCLHQNEVCAKVRHITFVSLVLQKCNFLELGSHSMVRGSREQVWGSCTLGGKERGRGRGKSLEKELGTGREWDCMVLEWENKE